MDQTELNIDPCYGFDPSYLEPPSWYKNISHENDYIMKGDGKGAKRKIYNNVEFTDFEKDGINKLMENVKNSYIELPHFWDDQQSLKICYSGRFNLKTCIKNLKQYIEWLNDPEMHNISPKSSQLLKNGFIYLHGRDIDLRPIIVFDVTKLELKETAEELIRSVSVILDMVKRYMFKPYHIENWVMIFDLADRGVLNLPLGKMKTIIGSISTYYCATLEKMYLLFPPWIIRKTWGIIEGWIDPETAQKINMVTQKDLPLLLKQIPKSMLQQKYGGEVPNLTSNFWPPKDLYQNERLEEIKRKSHTQDIIQIEQYKEEFVESSQKQPNNNSFQNDKENQPIPEKEINNNHDVSLNLSCNDQQQNESIQNHLIINQIQPNDINQQQIDQQGQNCFELSKQFEVAYEDKQDKQTTIQEIFNQNQKENPRTEVFPTLKNDDHDIGNSKCCSSCTLI